jgi:hypothetical protein
MATVETFGSHKIHIEGRWDIRDLYLFPHRYAEIYSFLYALTALEKPEGSSIAQTFHRYPWQGGYSAVHFYDELYASIPLESRPQIKRIEYASPGFIELAAIILLVNQIDNILTTAFKTGEKLDRIYDGIHRRYRKRRLAKLDLRRRERKLDEEDLKFTVQACKELAAAIGLENPEAIDKLTGEPLASLKILMAFYRRLRELVSFIQDGKVRMTRGDEKPPDETKPLRRRITLEDE